MGPWALSVFIEPFYGRILRILLISESEARIFQVLDTRLFALPTNIRLG
jgi:hypothetical protein